MLSSMNNIFETAQMFQSAIAPKMKDLTISNIRLPIFTDFMPFRKETFEDPSQNVLKEPEQESILAIFFKTLIKILFIGFYVLIAFFIAMTVANDMIVLPPPYRVLGFILTVTACFFPPAMFIFLSYYGMRAAYAASMNLILSPSSKPVPYFPRIFAILPLTTTQYESSTAQFLMYPFTFPKSEKAEVKLAETTKNYVESLENSFPGLNKYKASFSQSAGILEKALLSIINTNRRTPIQSVQEFMNAVGTVAAAAPPAAPTAPPAPPAAPTEPPAKPV